MPWIFEEYFIAKKKKKKVKFVSSQIYTSSSNLLKKLILVSFQCSNFDLNIEYISLSAKHVHEKLNEQL